MAAGHRVAAHSVLDRPEHGGTLPLDGDNTATNIMVGYNETFGNADQNFGAPRDAVDAAVTASPQ